MKDLSQKVLTASFWDSLETAVIPTPALAAPSNLEGLPAGSVLFASSGSSGVEKWIIHTRASLRASALAVNAHLGARSEDVFGLCLPAYHVGGFGVLARAYFARAQCALYEGKWEAKSALHWISREEVTALSLVPTQLYDLAELELRAPQSLRAVVIGGGGLEASLEKKARALGWPLLLSYGMTEAGSQVATQSLKSIKSPVPSTPLPLLPHWEAKVTEEGQLLLAGSALAWGQLIKKEGGHWEKERYGQWYETADRVTLSPEGLTYLGRQDRIIKIRGELVDLTNAEQTLKAHFNQEIILLADSSARAGYELVAVYEKGRAPLTRSALSALMPAFAPIERLVECPEIPRSALSKVDRRSLQGWVDKIGFTDC